MSVEYDIRSFMAAVGQLEQTDDEKRLIDFRISLIDEEYDELIQALQWGDPALIAKEIADVVYVVVGTAIALGIPFDEVFAAVHESNMSKLDDQGQPYRREDGKILKGPNYIPPEAQIAKLVRS